MHNAVFDSRHSSVHSYSRAFPGPLADARGTEIRDTDGRRYLDFLAGGGSLNYGHNHPVLKRELREHMASDSITRRRDMHTIAKARLIEAMQAYLFEPHGLEYRIQFTGPTGVHAVEAAMKLARCYTSRTNIVRFTNDHHAVPLGAMTFLPYDGTFGEGADTLEYFAQQLAEASGGLDLPAAVIVETVQGRAGGLVAASSDWLQRLEALCRSNGILLIVDDIEAGCGRTGQFFSFEASGVEPDLVTLSKSFSGFGLPLSVVLARPELDICTPAEEAGSVQGNYHAFVTAAVAIEHFWSNDEFAESIARRARQLELRLVDLHARHPSNLLALRGRGMLRGVVCADPAAAARVTRTAFERGLIIERSGPQDEVIKCLMPLTICEAELDEGLDILASACDSVFVGDLPTKRRGRIDFIG